VAAGLFLQSTDLTNANINDRNWKTFDERSFDFCQGITLHHLPGHTDGLVGMQINLPESGTIFFISDHCHVIENVSDSYLLNNEEKEE
jgi:glyoxylase-like metal-dependent hydrolase (beta-lactamase superfamily II)